VTYLLGIVQKYNYTLLSRSAKPVTENVTKHQSKTVLLATEIELFFLREFFSGDIFNPLLTQC